MFEHELNLLTYMILCIALLCYSLAIIFSLPPIQLKSNVVSVDSHVGQYAVICERQKAEVSHFFFYVYIS